MKNIYYTWEQFEADTKVIAGAILLSGFVIDKIYGIKKGGSFLAVSLSYMLNKEVDIISPKVKIEDTKNILIVDDICDSGKTFKDLLPNKNKNYRTACIYYNVKQNYVVDYFSRKINREHENSWIVFPWEMNT